MREYNKPIIKSKKAPDWYIQERVKSYEGEVIDELMEIHCKAYEDGIWLREFGCGSEGTYMTAAGSISELEEIEKQTGEEIDVSKLGHGNVIDISEPGLGETREEACRDAIKAFKRYLKTGKS